VKEFPVIRVCECKVRVRGTVWGKEEAEVSRGYVKETDPRYVMLRNSSAQPAPVDSAVGYMYDV